VYPALSASLLSTPALPRLLGDANRWLQVGTDDVPAKDVEPLVALKVLARHDDGDSVRWTYSADAFLAAVRAGIEADATHLAEYLSERYLFDMSTWSDIAAALGTAWCDYLEYDRGVFACETPEPVLSHRAAGLEDAVRSRLVDLEAFGPVPEAAELRQDLKRLSEVLRSATDVTAFEARCDDLLAMEARIETALQQWAGDVAPCRRPSPRWSPT